MSNVLYNNRVNEWGVSDGRHNLSEFEESGDGETVMEMSRVEIQAKV